MCYRALGLEEPSSQERPARADELGDVRAATRAPRPRRGVRQAGISSDLEADNAFASSLRELMPSFWNTLCRWYSTVRGLR
jgi:hypothetical protein